LNVLKSESQEQEVRVMTNGYVARQVFIAAALLLGVTSRAQTANSYIGANNGNWALGSNWSRGTVPSSGDDAFSTNGTQVRIQSGTAAVATNLTIGGTSGTSSVSLRQDSGGNSLTVGGSITLAPGSAAGQLLLGVGVFSGSGATLTIGGGSGAILDGGGAGASQLLIYGLMGTLGLSTATADDLNVNQNSSGSLTVGAGQTYTIGTTRVGSGTTNVTDALTVDGTLVSTTINPGAGAVNGTNNATFTLNAGGRVRATTIRRSGSQAITFNWNGGTLQNPSGGNLLVDGSAGLLTIGLAGTGTRTFNADSEKSITVAASAALADKPAEAGSWEKTGEGALLLWGTNTFTGAGTVRTGAVMAALSQSLPGWNTAGRYSVASNAALAVSPAAFSDANITTLVGAGHLAAGAHLLWGFDTTAGNATNASALADNASRAMGLGKFGANTLTLSAGSTYTGATVLYGGTLRAAHADALGSAGDITFKGGELAYTTSTEGKDWSSRYRNSTSAISLNITELASTSVVTNLADIGADNTGGLTLTYTGSSSPSPTLLLLGANAYTGGTRLIGNGNRGPYLQITNDLNLGGVPAVATPANLSLSVGRLSCAASLEIDSRRGISVANFVNEFQVLNAGTTVTYGGVISGSGDFRPIGSGLLRLTGTNSTFSGDFYPSGLCVVEVGRVANAGQPSSIGAGAHILISTASQTATLRYVGGGDSTDRDVKIGNGSLTTHTGGAVLESSGSGAWRFTNPSFNVSQATDADRTLTVSGTNTDSNAIDGVIADHSPTGLIRVVKSGAGKWLLNGACTYSGDTAVNAGTLLVGGSLASSAVTVASNALFGASGTAAARVAALTLEEGARVAWTYDGAARTGGIVRVTGALTLPSKAVLEVSAASAPTGTRVLFEAGSLAGATDLSGWSLSGAPAGAHVIRQGSAVVYWHMPGTMIRVL
jgi:fibronectin-binding autotransporter adhesin